jgi:glyceraldehyde 3-phosphate dehydrogenase
VADDDRIVAAASCTTHAAALPLWLLHRWFGVAAAEMTTVHCTTGSQVTIDGPHPDPRRARSALLSIIPTTTSASRGLVQALPFLADRLSCIAFRAPTACVSLVNLVVQTDAPVDSPEDLADRFRAEAAGPQQGRLGVSDEPLVSIDFRGDPHSSIIDLPLIARPGESLVRVVAWYDNEFGYASRVVDLLRLWSESGAREDGR